MGIPFCKKNRGFPNLPPATSQIGNSPYKTSVIIDQCCGLEGPLKIFFLDIFSFEIISRHPKECNWLISKRN